MNEELRSGEEGMPRSRQEKAARNYKAKIGAGVMDFIPEFRWIWRKTQEERCWNSCRRWNGVGDGRNKLAQRCFSLIPKNVSERPTELRLTMIRWWEAVREQQVAK